MDFSDFSKVFRSSGLVRSKKLRLTKNLIKPCVFTGFSHVRSCAHPSKIYKKNTRIGFSSESCNRSLSERYFFKLISVKMIPEGSPERSERRLGTLLGALEALLGRSWAALGRSWGALGRSWAALGRSWVALGRSWAALWSLLAALGPLLLAQGLPR